MPTKCINCPLRKRDVFVEMSECELAFMQEFKAGELKVEPGTTLMLEGSSSPQLYTVLDGMGLRYKMLENGERQVISFVMPGDFIGLQAGVMREMKHSVEASTDMVLCVFDRRTLWGLFRDHPERAFDLTWLAAVEEHFLGESLVVIGHMNGLARIARAFVRLHDRGESLGLAQNGVMKLPYKQQDLADALGLSLVHTNKSLKKLRERGIAEWRNGTLKILSYGKLCEMGLLDEKREMMKRPLI
ncbi:Crp/Fnr family transcriptional regulator [Roseovarius spongiae]|uniref:Crp/Fnr family transcriptional regulator n=1 Tax=Roseovarius spongiae TaxID=2320272 RepID=A0A3A8AXQ1_9RHOB|nr:Crp/Fnr family transcriptional regulator [Roseovarius spongiae]RKF14901.1 Crp/Fnr family transcriptional regulator [Roseovarius spongiae]